MKSVVFIISSFGEGGAQRVTANLANHLCDRYEVSVFLLWDRERAYALDPRIKIYTYPESSGLFRKVFPLSGRVLWCGELKKKLRPDVSVSFLPASNLVNVLSGSGEKRIVSERSDPSALDKKHLLMEMIAMQMADRIVFQSEYVRGQFPEAIQKKGCVLRNPVSVPFMASEERSNRIVNIGRLVPQKNQMMLIGAFYDFQKIHPEYKLDIYGTGSLEDELLTRIRSLDLADKVMLHGFVPDIYEAIRDAKMFVLSSDYEGMSNALAEAVMMGIACISTKTAGSSEIIRSMENGILTDIGDRGALADAMLRIAEDDDFRKKLERNAAETGRQFRTEMIAGQWEELL